MTFRDRVYEITNGQIAHLAVRESSASAGQLNCF